MLQPARLPLPRSECAIRSRFVALEQPESDRDVRAFAPFVSEHCFAWYPYVRGYEACQRSSSSWAALADWGSGRVVSESQAQAARQIPLYEEALGGVNGIKCHLQGPKVIVRHRAM